MPHPLDPFLSLSRRGLLRGAFSVASIAALTGTTARGVWATPVFHAYPFALGVASGDPLPDGVLLWTRLAPDPLNGGGLPMQAIEVGWELAADDRFRQIVQKGTVLARPELAHAVHVEVTGLAPARSYWFRFRAGSEVSAVGRTRTAPAFDATPARVAFANVGCNRYEDGYFTAYRHLAREELDFVFHSGDYIYTPGRAI
jgi:alkaline phosphatase D